ncbi:MAG TPA: pentapeptide repeat-containing protein [Armatimonadota bacterium]|nr:pentapeptide repeat-containing protein [Armatimonadota bacterium]
MIKIRHRISSALLHVLNGNTLAGADLHCLILSGAHLAGAQLRAANLRHVYMRGGDLRDVDLREADLTGADLAGADLAGADLRGARYDRFTRWPAGFDPRARGARRVERDALRQPARSRRRR